MIDSGIRKKILTWNPLILDNILSCTQMIPNIKVMYFIYRKNANQDEKEKNG